MAELATAPPRGEPPALWPELRQQGWSIKQSSEGDWYYVLTGPNGGRFETTSVRPSRGWPAAQLLGRDQADELHEEAVAVAVAACAADTAGQTCYICYCEGDEEGLVRGCACRGENGSAHVSCLARGAQVAVERDADGLDFEQWDTCGLCKQKYHGVVQCALGWACWKTYLGRPEGDEVRRCAMNQLGVCLSGAGQHEDALIVREAELSMDRRLGASEDDILATQSNLACTYHELGHLEEANHMLQDVYSGWVKIFGEEHPRALIAASNYAGSLIDLERFEETKALLRKTMPVARRVLGEDDRPTLMMRTNYGIALYADPGATLDDLGEAVTTSEDTARIARRVLGGSHPEVVLIERSLRCARAKLRAREVRDDESVAIPAQDLDIAQVTATKKRQRCDTSDRERSRPRVSAENDADDIE